jgi:hypothetical protein
MGYSKLRNVRDEQKDKCNYGGYCDAVHLGGVSDVVRTMLLIMFVLVE